LLAAMLMAQTEFALQDSGKKGDVLAEFRAGVEGVLRVYEVLLKSNPKDRQPFLDDLIQRRDAGTLAQWVKERAGTECKK
jgi:recombinational DNA repair ATPase RecF